MQRTPILTDGCQVADHVDEGPIKLLFDEQDYRFKTRFQIFGRPITGQTCQAKPRHNADSQFDTVQGESSAL